MIQTNKTIARIALLGIGVTLSLLVTGVARSAESPKPRAADVQKMEAALPDHAPAAPAGKHKVLVYGNANGFVHSSIPLGEETFAKMGEKTGAYTATVSNDPAEFDAERLRNFDAVVLVSTTGHFMVRKGHEAADREADDQRLENLIHFVQKDGKGLVGIHAATDAYYDKRAWGELIGGYFNGHPWNEKVGIKVDDPNSPLTRMFDKGGFDVADEIYQFTPKGKDGREQTYSRQELHLLLSLDYTTPGRTARKGQQGQTDFGVAWIHQDGPGRVFYCSLGHREEIYWNPAILKFYLAGVQYALGDLKAYAVPGNSGTARATGGISPVAAVR